jgi:crotonobetainyl-CoA:carnitine CoA-transferase CaiB-like acyl-CoA transferase
MLNEVLAVQHLGSPTVRRPGDVAPHLLEEVVLPAAGHDRWCVVDPQTPQQLTALRSVIGADKEDEIGIRLAEWLLARSDSEAASALQAAGVPAGRMVRVDELPNELGTSTRGMYETTTVPGTSEEVLVERFSAISKDLRFPSLEPMAAFGEHTRSVLAELGYLPDEISALFAANVAQEADIVSCSFGDRGH